MKRLIFGIVAGCLLVLLTGNTSVMSAERGLWVWSISEQLVEDYIENSSVNLWEDFISFLEAPHGNPNARITNVYMSTYNYTIFQPEKMRLFLAEMNSRGFNVYIVLAEPTYCLPRKDEQNRINVNPQFEQMIDRIITFQKKGTKRRSGKR